MGMYTGIRFKGIVKEEFRDKFEDIAMCGAWKESDILEFKIFGVIDRSEFIPCGGLSCMPEQWEQQPFDEYGYGVATDGFERAYDKDTGRWAFQCSLKNYNGVIETFFALIPFFVESIEHLEYFCEEWTGSLKYDLIDGKVILVGDFIEYYNNDDEYSWEDECYECGIYGNDYFVNDDGELESYCQYCSINPFNDDWDD